MNEKVEKVKAILDKECKKAIVRDEILLVCQQGISGACCHCSRNEPLAIEIVEAVK